MTNQTNLGPPLRFKAVNVSGMTRQNKYAISPYGVLKRIYLEQNRADRRPHISKPSYSSEDLVNMFIDHPDYIRLYNEWVDSGLKKELKPSIDRINNLLGYDLSNIQLLTWGENRKKGDKESRTTSVICFDKQWNMIKKFSSVTEASIETGCDKSSISRCCIGKQFSSTNKNRETFRFKYTGESFNHNTVRDKYKNNEHLWGIIVNKPSMLDKLVYLGIYPSDLKVEAFFPGLLRGGVTTGFPKAIRIIHTPSGTRFESVTGFDQLENRKLCLEKVLKWAEEKRAGEVTGDE